MRGHRKSNKINIGAMEAAAQPSAAQPSAAATTAAILADPWSGSDQWSTGECLPCAEQVNAGVRAWNLSTHSAKPRARASPSPHWRAGLAFALGIPLAVAPHHRARVKPSEVLNATCAADVGTWARTALPRAEASM